MKAKGKRIFFAIALAITVTFTSLSNSQTKDPGKVYRVAILPFLMHSQENLDYLREGIYDMLSSRLAAVGNIILIERSVVERAFYDERPMRLDESVAKRIGMRAGADYIILGSLTKIGDYISLDARLISITEEKPPVGAFTQHKGIEDVMLTIGDFAQDIGNKISGKRPAPSRPTEPRHPYLVQPKKELGRIDPEGLGFKKSQTFKFEAKGVDVADIDGDQKNELILMDSHNLYVFKYDGEKMTLFRRIEAGIENNFLTLDVADVNRNGTAEIIVTSVVEDNLKSFILEYEENTFRKVMENANWFFRVLDHPKEGPILIGQRMDYEGLIAGPIYAFQWKRKSFERGPKMDFPNGLIIFGIAVADLRKQGNFDIVRLEDSERLSILSSDGKFSWTSKVRYGGTNNYYETYKKETTAYLWRDYTPWRVRIPGRVLIKDLDGDGIKEIIVNKNGRSVKILDRVRDYDTGVIYSLIWQDGTLDTSWKTREINGYVTDFQIKDVDNDGDEELVVAVIDLGSITDRKGTSNVLFFKLF